MNVVIVKKKNENRDNYCLRATISVSRLSTLKQLITTLSPSHGAEGRSGVTVLATRIKYEGKRSWLSLKLFALLSWIVVT